MQKKLIALAIAGLASTTAFAQSNVTIYGIVDAYVGQIRGDGDHTQTVVNSGGLSTSRLGFKGSEDLGGGLKALFTLEYALAVDQNATIGGMGAGGTNAYFSGTYARQQFVGLGGDFGTLTLGRQQGIGFNWAVKYETLGGSHFSALGTAQCGSNTRMMISGLCGDNRMNNSIAYVSPSFSGFTAAVNYTQITEETALNSAGKNAARAYVLGLNYENGPVAVGVVYDRHSSDVANTSYIAPTQSTDWAIGGSYDFGVAKLQGTYQSHKLNETSALIAANADAGQKDKAWSLGTVVPVTAAGKVHVVYSRLNNDSRVDDSDAKVYALAYTHDLSKRTTLYGAYQHSDNNGLSTGVKAFPSLSTVNAGGASSMYGVGVRHMF